MTMKMKYLRFYKKVISINRKKQRINSFLIISVGNETIK